MKLQNSRLVWAGPSWRLRVEEVLLPDGRTFERGAIEHPGAVVLVPLRESPSEPEILMIRQYRFVLDEEILELPAGTRHWDEDWLACAQRELREETGYRAARLHRLGDIWPAPGSSDELMALYLATGLTEDPLPGDVDEAITVTPMPLADLIVMAQDGRLRDAKTVVGILRTAVYWAQKQEQDR